MTAPTEIQVEASFSDRMFSLLNEAFGITKSISDICSSSEADFDKIEELLEKRGIILDEVSTWKQANSDLSFFAGMTWKEQVRKLTEADSALHVALQVLHDHAKTQIKNLYKQRSLLIYSE